MKELNLTVEKRDGTGKGVNRRLRQAGDIPAVVYGPETDPIPVKVNYKNLYRLMHDVPMNTIINLDITGMDEPARKVLIRELQKDPVSGELLHLDFHHIPMDKPITLTIPITAVGIPEGVKTFGGIVQYARREIDISCLPSDIPDTIEIDITALNVGDSIHVSDLKLDNVTVLTDPIRTLITVVAPTVIKSAAEEAEEAAEGEEGEEGEEGAEGEAKEGEAKEGEGKPEGEAKEGEKKEEGGDKKKKK
jgi:large subunit ribosomal protein L25